MSRSTDRKAFWQRCFLELVARFGTHHSAKASDESLKEFDERFPEEPICVEPPAPCPELPAALSQWEGWSPTGVNGTWRVGDRVQVCRQSDEALNDPRDDDFHGTWQPDQDYVVSAFKTIVAIALPGQGVFLDFDPNFPGTAYGFPPSSLINLSLEERQTSSAG